PGSFLGVRLLVLTNPRAEHQTLTEVSYAHLLISLCVTQLCSALGGPCHPLQQGSSFSCSESVDTELRSSVHAWHLLMGDSCLISTSPESLKRLERKSRLLLKSLDQEGISGRSTQATIEGSAGAIVQAAEWVGQPAEKESGNKADRK
ncbi:hypothetical protein J0S82_010469, partial [Galemys pyrenaicus]